MTRSNRLVAVFALASLTSHASLSLASAPGSADAPQPSVWQHRQANFTYLGITSRYTCDGLEDKVRDILRYFGARDGMKIDVQGCPRGPTSLSLSAWVTMQFDTLAAAASDAPATDLVQGQWTPVRLSAQRPYFMGEGDCELIDAMRKSLTQNFSLRALAYNARCTPHAESLLDFRVEAEVLKATKGHAGAG